VIGMSVTNSVQSSGSQNNTAAAPLATPRNIQDLAALIMSEASVGNEVERRSVGSTVLNRMRRNGTSTVRDVWGAYAHAQAPAPDATALAEDLLQGHIIDPTNGATHYYTAIDAG
jgi:spore germination cell wall hydrolase CwlJ-like protein